MRTCTAISPIVLVFFRNPFLPNRTRDSKHDRSHEYAHESKCSQASECAEHDEEERYPGDAADKEGTQHIVYRVHE